MNGSIVASGVRRLSKLSIISHSSHSENITKSKKEPKSDDCNHNSTRRMSAAPRQRANSDPADGKAPVTMVHFKPADEEEEDDEDVEARAEEAAEKAMKKQARARRREKAASLIFFIMIVVITVIYFYSEGVSNRGIDVKQHLLDNVNKSNIKSGLRELARLPHPTGSDASASLTELVAATWREQGLQLVTVKTYDVLLSRPHDTLENTVRLLDAESGLEVHRSSPWQPAEPQWPQQAWSSLLPAFSAFASTGTVRGEVVYCNYGRAEDYTALQALNITAGGRLVLARHGNTSSGDKQREAEARGAVGLILYGDPADVARSGPPYPASAGAPGGAARLDSLLMGGDPLTPALPSLDWVTRLEVGAAGLPLEGGAAGLPSIPVQPIGYDDALQIISRMGGVECPPLFVGGLEAECRTGPERQDNITLQLEVTNTLTPAPVSNVLGVIWGQERDRLVVVGAPRDAWGYGGSDSASASAVLLELTRLFGGLAREEGWTPARTLVFASWGGSTDGLMGSTEWVQHYAAALSARSVAYLNLAHVMTGNQSFLSSTLPLLYGALEAAAQDVPSPFAGNVWPNGSEYTLLDSWRARSVDPATAGRPRHGGLGATSDYWAFMYLLGVPSADFSFLDEGGSASWAPLQHTAYDSFELVTEILDPSMAFHEASAKLWALLVFQFAHSPVLPLSVLAQSDHLLLDSNDLLNEHEDVLLELDVSLRPLTDQLQALRAEATVFERRLRAVDTQDPFSVRAANDALLLCCRALLDPRGALGQQAVRDEVFSPGSGSSFEMAVFPGIRDLLASRGQLEDAQLALQLRQVVQATAYRVMQARLAITNTMFSAD